jgi:hypothetical protein
MKTDGELYGVLLILLGAMLIGLMPAFAKFAYLDGANALLLLLARSIIGVAILVVFILLTGRAPGVTPVKMRRSFNAGLSHVFATIGLLGSIVYIDISLANIILFLYSGLWACRCRRIAHQNRGRAGPPTHIVWLDVRRRRRHHLRSGLFVLLHKRQYHRSIARIHAQYFRTDHDYPVCRAACWRDG